MDLMTESPDSTGVRALKTFLDYAENRNLSGTIETGEDTDSPFEDEVYEFLRGQGHQVKNKLGARDSGLT